MIRRNILHLHPQPTDTGISLHSPEKIEQTVPVLQLYVNNVTEPQQMIYLINFK